MNRREIEKRIKGEENFIKRAEEEILDLRAAVECSKKALKMWKDELDGANRRRSQSIVVVEANSGLTLSNDKCKSRDELIATFKDAYKFYVGRKPTEKAVKTFLEKGEISAKNGVRYDFFAVSA